MAKQNVTFFSAPCRENRLPGVAGAVLLAMVWLYGINSPAKVSDGGENLCLANY